MDGSVEVEAFAPGRVNLIGDHTDYAGGLAMPMAIQLGTTVRGRRDPELGSVALRSHDLAGPIEVPLGIADPRAVEPSWGRYVAGVVHELRPTVGFRGDVTSTLPIGSGLSSSAALELAVALALGFDGPPRALAEVGQRAEQVASGVPCGIMDQLASACGREGAALLVDFTTMAIGYAPVPADAEIVVVHSGEPRALADSAYGERRAACERAATEIGSLHDATLDDVARLADPTLVRRARHVVSENLRVTAFAAALHTGDLVEAGRLMGASHASLRDDFDVSTAALDALVARLTTTPGVFGARLTGAGFGGCVVALTRPGALAEGWVVTPSPGAHVRPRAGR